uniref:G_PROTEIN_RECEP_F1_2 domain-containing protein n=1 Tax=Angiostrongylus cantonensis TaxID=6313 RepID=A0A0K0D4T5_ANGCA
LFTNTAISCAQIGTADLMQQLFHGDFQRNGWDHWRTGFTNFTLPFVVTISYHTLFISFSKTVFSSWNKMKIKRKKTVQIFLTRELIKEVRKVWHINH